ncbi:uncharacterized protein EV420DRAFT_1769653 [Desarmillaria tabescens]|uniref:Uncharacterized protein n=1 Tax=Armillaria tabescens TaxID=1929756 RepID=A0AA39MM65_ARMTA|nr:uncharacterized protein EV420DRAFT_1769653 [Desarmillaria tabescens]KAK0438515.1 hypothetical protein EV420DRAFT_1769653 [Desarmillaria tabescens]
MVESFGKKTSILRNHIDSETLPAYILVITSSLCANYCTITTNPVISRLWVTTKSMLHSMCYESINLVLRCQSQCRQHIETHESNPVQPQVNPVILSYHPLLRRIHPPLALVLSAGKSSLVVPTSLSIEESCKNLILTAVHPSGRDQRCQSNKYGFTIRINTRFSSIPTDDWLAIQQLDTGSYGSGLGSWITTNDSSRQSPPPKRPEQRASFVVLIAVAATIIALPDGGRGYTHTKYAMSSLTKAADTCPYLSSLPFPNNPFSPTSSRPLLTSIPSSPGVSTANSPRPHTRDYCRRVQAGKIVDLIVSPRNGFVTGIQVLGGHGRRGFRTVVPENRICSSDSSPSSPRLPSSWSTRLSLQSFISLGT